MRAHRPDINEGRGIPAISTGEMLRGEISADTELGRNVQAIMAAGGLVPDHMINLALAARIEQADCSNGFMLDGYPRTVEQAEFLDRLLRDRGFDEPLVIHLDVPADVLVGRVISRRQCSKCGRMYNVLSDRPKVEGRCDDDGEPLITRKDDQGDTIRERLRTYNEMTRPVIAHYPSERYFQIMGDRSQAYIFEEITGILEPILNHAKG